MDKRRVKTEEKKIHPVMIWFTEKDFQTIKEKASEWGFVPGTYIRYKMLLEIKKSS